MLNNVKNIHMIGIGGTGMSGIAQILLSMGFNVSGSDLNANKAVKRLIKNGAKIFVEHNSNNVSTADIIVYSTSISKDNPEMIYAAENNISIIHRAEMLAELMKSQKTIAVTGTHGKTTTTSLIAHILLKAELAPSIAVGSYLSSIDGNGMFGKGEYFVAEADESDGSFLKILPYYSIITNIEKEHMEYYKNMEHIVNTYRRFVASTNKQGCVFYGGNLNDLSKVIGNYRGEVVTYGLSNDRDIYAENIKILHSSLLSPQKQKSSNKLSSKFTVYVKNKMLGKVQLPLLGLHNISNAVCAIAVCLKIGLNFENIVLALKSFGNIGRRFEVKYDDKFIIVDDYAHHPTEIEATINSAKLLGAKRIFCVFQPHRYTRSMHLEEEFGKCFKKADKIVITDIYSAGEEQIDGITAENIYDRVVTNGNPDISFVHRNQLSQYILDNVQENDLVLMLGAGDIIRITDQVINCLKIKGLPIDIKVK